MKYLVSLYDRATEAYGPIMTVPTRAVALREFRQACNDNTSPISKHPTDYELYQLATYDDQTGEIITAHEMLARAEDMKGA